MFRNTWRTALEKTIKEVDFDFVINKNLLIRTILRIWTFLQIKNEIDQIVRPPKNTDSAKLLRIQVRINLLKIATISFYAIIFLYILSKHVFFYQRFEKSSFFFFSNLPSRVPLIFLNG